MARRLGVGSVHVFRVEKGEKRYSEPLVRKLVRLLGLSKSESDQLFVAAGYAIPEALEPEPLAGIRELYEDTRMRADELRFATELFRSTEEDIRQELESTVAPVRHAVLVPPPWIADLGDVATQALLAGTLSTLSGSGIKAATILDWTGAPVLRRAIESTSKEAKIAVEMLSPEAGARAAAFAWLPKRVKSHWHLLALLSHYVDDSGIRLLIQQHRESRRAVLAVCDDTLPASSATLEKLGYVRSDTSGDITLAIHIEDHGEADRLVGRFVVPTRFFETLSEAGQDHNGAPDWRNALKMFIKVPRCAIQTVRADVPYERHFDALRRSLTNKRLERQAKSSRSEARQTG